jgi:hypothetical protein
MSLVKNNKEITKLMLTDPTVIELAEQDFVYITKYPSVKFYSNWIKSIVDNDADQLEALAVDILKDQQGAPLLKNPEDVIQHDVFEHILTKVTEYLVKSKTKNLTQDAPLESTSI